MTQKTPLTVLTSGSNERQLGQYYTLGNPFSSGAFFFWWRLFLHLEHGVPLSITPASYYTQGALGACWNPPELTSSIVLYEPFAGACHIPEHLRTMGLPGSWRCFDLDPPAFTHNIPVAKKDVLTLSGRHYPKSSIVITNPPYLATNSATRRGLSTPGHSFEDLYQHALDVMLQKSSWVAAIIPESFLTQQKFFSRTLCVVSLRQEYFEHTDHPVCLALFVPQSIKMQLPLTLAGEPFYQTPLADPLDFFVWHDEKLMGTYRTLTSWWTHEVEQKAHLLQKEIRHQMQFNVPNGRLALFGLDNTLCASIHFSPGKDIPSDKVKPSSRSLTRIHWPYFNRLPVADQKRLIALANTRLAEYRQQTGDILLTAFKGRRKDGPYRRRLDFKSAKLLLLSCVGDLASSQPSAPSGKK